MHCRRRELLKQVVDTCSAQNLWSRSIMKTRHLLFSYKHPDWDTRCSHTLTLYFPAFTQSSSPHCSLPSDNCYIFLNSTCHHLACLFAYWNITNICKYMFICIYWNITLTRSGLAIVSFGPRTTPGTWKVLSKYLLKACAFRFWYTFCVVDVIFDNPAI